MPVYKIGSRAKVKYSKEPWLSKYEIIQRSSNLVTVNVTKHLKLETTDIYLINRGPGKLKDTSVWEFADTGFGIYIYNSTVDAYFQDIVEPVEEEGIVSNNIDKTAYLEIID